MFTALFRPLSVSCSATVQAQRIYCRTVFIPSVLCVLLYAYLHVSGLQVKVSLLKTCCRAVVPLARNGPTKITTATTCHCWMTSTPYAGKWTRFRCQIVVLVLQKMLKAALKEEMCVTFVQEIIWLDGSVGGAKQPQFQLLDKCYGVLGHGKLQWNGHSSWNSKLETRPRSI